MAHGRYHELPIYDPSSDKTSAGLRGARFNLAKSPSRLYNQRDLPRAQTLRKHPDYSLAIDRSSHSMIESHIFSRFTKQQDHKNALPS